MLCAVDSALGDILNTILEVYTVRKRKKEAPRQYRHFQ